jgi:hypothetical protein
VSSRIRGGSGAVNVWADATPTSPAPELAEISSLPATRNIAKHKVTHKYFIAIPSPFVGFESNGGGGKLAHRGTL